MSVHSSERKLDAINTNTVTCFKYRAPRRGYGVSSKKTTDGIEVEAGKNNIETSEPKRALPRAARRVEVDLLRHREIELIEPLDAVIRWQHCIDSLHPRNYIVDCHRNLARDKVVERLICRWYGHIRSHSVVGTSWPQVRFLDRGTGGRPVRTAPENTPASP